jgi:hypothetical protein
MSHSSFGTVYEVLIPDPSDNPNEWICNCQGFHYRGHCAHQNEAYAKVCRWTEPEGPEQQTPAQTVGQVCPRCTGPTVKILIDD